MKITLSGYGYTFVAKAVQDHHAFLLDQELDVYNDLYKLQGSIIPACLGLVELMVPYPMDDLSALSYKSIIRTKIASSLVQEADRIGPLCDFHVLFRLTRQSTAG